MLYNTLLKHFFLLRSKKFFLLWGHFSIRSNLVAASSTILALQAFSIFSFGTGASRNGQPNLRFSQPNNSARISKSRHSFLEFSSQLLPPTHSFALPSRSLLPQLALFPNLTNRNMPRTAPHVTLMRQPYATTKGNADIRKPARL